MSVQVKRYQPPKVDIERILRYAKTPQNETILALTRELLHELADKLTYRVCYRVLDISVIDSDCNFGYFSLQAADLAQNLRDCERCVIFAAGIGIEIDRMIAKYSRLSPVKALLLQAIGTERVEALCDLFCDDISKTLGSRCHKRFSPGYGAVPLSVQRHFFELLQCEKHIGVCLTDSFLMTPTKSVTAFIGVEKKRSCEE